MVARFCHGDITRMDDPEPTTDEEIRTFVARKVGELHADLAKLIATIDYLAPPGQVRRYRWLTYGILLWLIILTVVLIGHALFSAGLIGR